MQQQVIPLPTSGLIIKPSHPLGDIGGITFADPAQESPTESQIADVHPQNESIQKHIMHFSLRLISTSRFCLECFAIFVISRTLGPVAADCFAEYWRLMREMRKKHFSASGQ